MLFQTLLFVAIFALLCMLVRQACEQRLQVITLALLVILLPLHENLISWGMLAISVLIIVTFIFNKSRQFTWQPLFYAIVGLYFLNFAWLLFMGDFNFANKGIDSAVPMVLFPILFSMVQLSKKNVQLLLRFFVWIVIVVCVYGLLSYVFAAPEISLLD